MNMSIQEHYNPVKEYKWFNNLNLDLLFNTQEPSLKNVKQPRSDIDYDMSLVKNKDYVDAYNRRVIRQYSPWEDYLGQDTIRVNTEESCIEHQKLVIDSTNTFSEKKLEYKKRKPSKGLIGTLLAILGILFVKAKGLLIFLFAKIFPVLGHVLSSLLHFKGILLTLGSMIVTIIMYATIFKFELAVGLVILIFIHEAGHALMIASKGIKAGLPVFIPFFGAFIAIKDIPKDVLTEAQIAIGGPFLGGLSAFVMLIMYGFTVEPVWLYLANIGFIMNLFNLTPVSPLDGGRIVSVISRKMWFLGFLVLLVLTLIYQTPVLLLVLIFSLGNLLKPQEYPPGYYKTPALARSAFTVAYFAMVVMLGFSAYETAIMLTDLHLQP